MWYKAQFFFFLVILVGGGRRGPKSIYLYIKTIKNKVIRRKWCKFGEFFCFTIKQRAFSRLACSCEGEFLILELGIFCKFDQRPTSFVGRGRKVNIKLLDSCKPSSNCLILYYQPKMLNLHKYELISKQVSMFRKFARFGRYKLVVPAYS